MQLRDEEVRELLGALDARLDRIESLPDPAARAAATEAVQILLQVYGEGLERVMDKIRDASSPSLAARLAEDELVSHLLVLHDLHPAGLEDRILGALEETRPYLQSHGGNVELLRVEGAVAYLRLQGSCSGCPSSSMTLKMAIEDAIRKAAPELERIEAEGSSEPDEPPAGAAGFVPLSAVGPPGGVAGKPANGKGSAPPGETWTVVGALPQLAGGGLLVKEVGRQPLVFLKLNDTFYAYRHRCPSCGASLEDAALQGTDLTCPGCGHSYDVVRAGRCTDAPDIHLEPVPLLLEDGGLVRVAVPPGGAET